MPTEIYAGTATSISLEVQVQTSGSYTDPTTLAIVITQPTADGNDTTTYDIDDLTKASTGKYSIVHCWDADDVAGKGYVTAKADVGTTTAIVSEGVITIKAPHG